MKTTHSGKQQIFFYSPAALLNFNYAPKMHSSLMIKMFLKIFMVDLWSIGIKFFAPTF